MPGIILRALDVYSHLILTKWDMYYFHFTKEAVMALRDMNFMRLQNTWVSRLVKKISVSEQNEDKKVAFFLKKKKQLLWTQIF